MIQELDTVVLTRDIPAEGLRKGDLGAVVLMHQNGAAVRAATGRELPHAREVA
jgi:uncharacterized protein DUF4926